MRMLRVPTAALFKRIDERGHDPRTASTQRVAERDGTAVDICPVPFRPIEHLIYNFPVLISSTLFRIGVQFSD